MARYSYLIDKNNAISFFDAENPNENDAPFMFQPDWPDTTPWSSVIEASRWADQLILSLEDDSADLPGWNPEMPTIERVIEEPVI